MRHHQSIRVVRGLVRIIGGIQGLHNVRGKGGLTVLIKQRPLSLDRRFTFRVVRFPPQTLLGLPFLLVCYALGLGSESVR